MADGLFTTKVRKNEVGNRKATASFFVKLVGTSSKPMINNNLPSDNE